MPAVLFQDRSEAKVRTARVLPVGERCKVCTTMAALEVTCKEEELATELTCNSWISFADKMLSSCASRSSRRSSLMPNETCSEVEGHSKNVDNLSCKGLIADLYAQAKANS